MGNIMRIAFSGAHSTGKSTLIEALAGTMPHAVVVDEPYYALMADGVHFAERPEAADYTLMWERAQAECLAARDGAALFDRTPADFLAYVTALDAAHAEPTMVADTQRALASIDLVVFVPIESPDRIATRVELPRLRRRVDGILREMWVDDAWGWDRPVLEVHGSLQERVAQVRGTMMAVRDCPDRAD